MNIPDTYPVVNEFEKLYIRLRQKEGRIYKDDEVANLPYINKDHPNAKEWGTREWSSKKLLTYIRDKATDPTILEIGCGNGWLSAQLATATKGNVIGTDINDTELEQAKRVFHQHSNLVFTNGDLHNGTLADKKFDIIIFAASIQYFSSLKEVINTVLKYLMHNGEIHILDSHFYPQKEIAVAKLRTKEYYASIGFDELTNYYHHHAIETLNGYRYKILQDPFSWKKKLSANKYPFHWIIIKKH